MSDIQLCRACPALPVVLSRDVVLWSVQQSTEACEPIMPHAFQKKRILLVNPWIHDFAAHDHWAKPMGLLYIASLLRLMNYNIDYLDCLNLCNGFINDAGVPRPRRTGDGRGRYPKEEITRPAVLEGIPRRYSRYGSPPPLASRVLDSLKRPDLVLVTSFMTYWYPGVAETIRLIRSRWASVPLVLGGIYATLCTDHALRHSGADAVVSGDGIKDLAGLLSNVFGDPSELPVAIDRLDSLPYPAFDLLPFLDQVPILTSRGCPFRCTYCAAHRLEPVYRRRDPLAVADEITHWHERYGIRDFSFYDDALLVHPDEMIRPLLRELLRRRLPLRFHCPNGLHLREVDDDLGLLLFRAGFRTLRFGFETADEDRQRETGGKTRSGDLERALRSLRKAGYREGEVGVYLLCGLPGQSAEEISSGIEYVRKCGARPILAEYSPIPGTALWEEAVEASPYPIAGEPLFHNNTLLPCGAGELTPERYRELKRKALAAGGSAG